ncbi:TPA: hypothetical protein ACIU9G_004606, partial [Salmonella enterica subsp. enterica serovar Birkenhead]
IINKIASFYIVEYSDINNVNEIISYWWFSLYKYLYNSLKCEKKHVYGSLPGTLLIRQQHLPLSGYASLTHPEISYLQK